MPAGDTVQIHGDDGEVLYSYRSFVSVVPLVALVVAVVVFFTGISAVAFLFAEGRPVPAIVALILSGAFLVLIAMLVPAIGVVLNDANGNPALNLAQQSNASFPIATFVVSTPDRKVLARIQRTIWSRLGRNRWTILPSGNSRPLGVAREVSLARALVRKVAGKFNPRYQTDIFIEHLGKEMGRIIRKPNSEGEMDVLEVTGDIDRRVAVALALLVLGSEP